MDKSIDEMLLEYSLSLPSDDEEKFNDFLDDSLNVNALNNIDKCDDGSVLSLIDWFNGDNDSIKIILETYEQNHSKTQIVGLLKRVAYSKSIANESVVNMLIKHLTDWKATVAGSQNGFCPITFLYAKGHKDLIQIMLSNGLSKADLIG